MSVEKPSKKIMFVDYNFSLDGEDVIFDKELEMERMRFYEGKTFKVKQTSEGIMLKFIETWEINLIPDDLERSKYENQENSTH